MNNSAFLKSVDDIIRVHLTGPSDKLSEELQGINDRLRIIDQDVENLKAYRDKVQRALEIIETYGSATSNRTRLNYIRAHASNEVPAALIDKIPEKCLIDIFEAFMIEEEDVITKGIKKPELQELVITKDTELNEWEELIITLVVTYKISGVHRICS